MAKTLSSTTYFNDLSKSVSMTFQGQTFALARPGELQERKTCGKNQTCHTHAVLIELGRLAVLHSHLITQTVPGEGDAPFSGISFALTRAAMRRTYETRKHLSDEGQYLN